jgi:hypothetical protein
VTTSVRSGPAGAAERQAHRHLGAAVGAAGDREAVAEGADQGEAEAQAGPLDVGPRADSDPPVADDDNQAVTVGAGLDVERPGAALVGVDGDVHAGLGDDRLEVGQARFVHPDLLRQPGEDVADHGNVCRFGWKHHLKPPGLVADRRAI